MQTVSSSSIFKNHVKKLNKMTNSVDMQEKKSVLIQCGLIKILNNSSEDLVLHSSS